MVYLIESLKSLTCCKHNIVDTFREKCYSDILELVCKVVIEKRKPGTSKLRLNHNNAPSESTYDYFKKLVAIPLLYHLIVEI